MILKKKSYSFDGKYLLHFCPEVTTPDYRLSLQERLIWTFLVFLVYQVLCRIPLYGGIQTTAFDPLFFFRGILASDRGTVMELGVAPFITVDLIFHLLTAFSVVSYNPSNQEDRLRRRNQRKVLGLIFTIFEAIGYTAASTSIVSCFEDFRRFSCTILQLCLAGILLILLEEILSQGYGFDDHNYHLFIASNICESTISHMLSPRSINTSTGLQKEGALIALFHLFFSRSNKFYAIIEAVCRSSAPNLFSCVVTVFIFCLLVYVQGYHIRLFVKKNRVRSQQSTYPIKLFYTSSLPILLQTCLVYNVYLISQILSTRFSENILVRSFGRWTLSANGGQMIPSGGLVYYISPPDTLVSFLIHPLHTFSYITFVLLTCLVFSNTWLASSGHSPKHIATSFRSQGIVLRGHRDASIVVVLNRYIPTACLFGGLALGALTIVGNIIGGANSGTAAVIATSILYQCYEAISTEFIQS